MKKIYSIVTLVMLLFSANAMADSQKWTLTSYSSADIALITGDTSGNWSEDSSVEGRYIYSGALSAAALTASGSELAATEGLLFTCNSGGKLRINTASSRFELNGSNIVVTIPDLEAGQKVTVSCKTASSSTARGLYQSNLTSTSNFDTASTDALTCTGTVAADGNVTLTTSDGGMYLYYITVEDPAEGESDGSVDISGYNYVSANSDANQMKLLLTSNDLLYYNVDDISVEIDNDAETLTVNANDGSYSDVFTQTVEKMSFAEAAETGTEGTYENTSGIQILTAKGWHESLYAKWEAYSGATGYNVYVKGGQYSDYTQIDGMLVREYEDYYRADMVGLQAGEDYCIKIIATDSDGEISASENEATGMIVDNYSREGFAHLNYSGVGAYNDDGTLKSGAKVFYVTAETAATISTDVQTSSSGYTTATGIQDIIYRYQKGYDSTPIAFRIIGMITEDDVDYLASSSEGLQIKGKSSYNEIPITIEGIGDDATIHGFGFLIRNAACVELRNFAIMDFMDDGVSIDTKNCRIWVHNLDIFYGATGSDSDQSKGDGSIDIKGNSQYITVDNCRFWDSGKCSLCGLSESSANYITYHHNWFDHADSRMARVRTMSVHIYNNYYDGIGKYGVGSTMASSVFVDRNYFRATGRPMMISEQGTDATGDGTFSGEDGGIIKAYGNVFAEKPSAFSYITYDDSSTSFDAYEVDDPTETVPSSVVTLSGGTSYDNFDTDADLMYDYSADDAEDIPSIVTGYYGAGRLNHGDFEYEISGDYGSYEVDTALKSAIENYTSSLVSVLGTDSNGTSDGTTNDSDSNSGTGSDTSDSDSSEELPEGTIIVEFDDGQSTYTGLVNVTTGNTSSSKGTATYGGNTYSICLKMESSTSVTITTSEVYNMTLVFGDSETASFKLDGTAYTGTGSTYTFSNLAAGTYTLTKNASVNLYLIVFEPVDSTTDDSTTDDSTTDDGTTDDGTTDDGTTDDSTTDDSTTDSSETVIVDFSSSASSNTSYVTVNTGNFSSSKGTATYNGTTYSTCLKMESSTDVTLTCPSACSVTLVFGDDETASFKLDGTAYTGSGSTYTLSLDAGSYTLTKNTTVNLYLVVFEPNS